MRTARWLRAAVAVLCAGAAGCTGAGSGTRVPGCCLDLLTELPRADVRPTGSRDETARAVEAVVGGSRRQSLSVSVPSRVIFRVHIPRKATLSSTLAVERVPPVQPGDSALTTASAEGVEFHVGISDGRTYEEVANQRIFPTDSTAAARLTVDLRGYAGWQWSLFYRPSSITWQIVLNAYPVGASAGRMRAIWASPTIVGTAP